MENENENKELEYKYNGSGIDLVNFEQLMEKMEYNKKIEVSSWDYYYTNKTNNFIRYRKSNIKPELTIKRKTKKQNNQDRIEVNLPLHPDIKEDIIASYNELLGYELNFKIYKSCFIYFFDYVNTVYYTVYDENMNEQGRFIEIEFDEKRVKELGQEKAFEILKTYEQKMSGLGISPQRRLKKSLFEIFVK